MTGSPHGGHEEQSGHRDTPEPVQPQGDGYPGYADPAYASQAGYGPTYQAPAGPPPTGGMSGYPPYGYDPYATGQYGQQAVPSQEPPPDEQGAPRWLWAVAGIGVVTVVGLVVALVIVNVNSSRQERIVAPMPSLQEPSFTTPTPTTPRRPTAPVLPLPTVPSTPPTTGSATPGATETVVYDVTGSGRAINITYVDTGGLLQTEFNVMLPWHKQVELAQPAEGSASISIINVGREVSCSITVNGAVAQQRTGTGLTICTVLR